MLRIVFVLACCVALGAPRAARSQAPDAAAAPGGGSGSAAVANPATSVIGWFQAAAGGDHSAQGDAFALSHDSFAGLLPKLPGARVLAGHFQQTGIAVAVPKGRSELERMVGRLTMENDLKKKNLKELTQICQQFNIKKGNIKQKTIENIRKNISGSI